LPTNRSLFRWVSPDIKDSLFAGVTWKLLARSFDSLGFPHVFSFPPVQGFTGCSDTPPPVVGVFFLEHLWFLPRCPTGPPSPGPRINTALCRGTSVALAFFFVREDPHLPSFLLSGVAPFPFAPTGLFVFWRSPPLFFFFWVRFVPSLIPSILFLSLNRQVGGRVLGQSGWESSRVSFCFSNPNGVARPFFLFFPKAVVPRWPGLGCPSRSPLFPPLPLTNFSPPAAVGRFPPSPPRPAPPLRAPWLVFLLL